MSEYNKGSSRKRTATDRNDTGAAKRSTSGQANRSSYSTSGRSTSDRSTSGHSASGHGTSGRNSSGHYSSGYGAGGNRRRKRRGDWDITTILMYGIGALVLILCLVLVARGCGKLPDGKVNGNTEVSETASTEAVTESPVTVDGIDITGMSQEEAKTAILNKYGWDMKITYGEKEAKVTNLIEPRVNDLLEEIYAGEMAASYEVKTDNLLEAAKAEASLLAGNWSMVAKNGGISGYDKDTGKFTFSQGTNGVVIDQDALAQSIMSAITSKDYKAVIAAKTKDVAPDMTAEQLKEKYKTISTYTTKTTSNSNRNENIRLSCNAINGTIVNPGQEFSFNNTTGARTEAKGYKPASAYLNGEVVQEPGGGVCQISSTLYNAVVFAGLTSTERHAHSYEPSYVTPGEDAAVSFGGPDFKFVNNSDYPIAIKTSFVKQELTISIYGVPILKEGMKVRMSSKKVGTIDPPAAPTYEEDQTLQPNVENIVKEGTPGSRWSTDLVVYQDDKEMSREFFHNSSYRGKAAVVKRNTSGVVVTLPAVTEPVIGETSAAVTLPAGETVGPAGPGQNVEPTVPDQTSPVSPGNRPGGETTAGPISPGGEQQPPVSNTIPAPGMGPDSVGPGPIGPGPG